MEPMFKLRGFLEQNKTTETVIPDRIYRLLGVRLEGNGPFIREEKLGSQIRAKKLQRVSSGDFIYSRLFAWRGALGLIPDGMDGAYVSNEFPSFRVDENKVFPKFLGIYFKQRRIWEEIEKHCTGTTKASRNRFKEKFFLDFEIPLPNLEEQKRVVEKIERLIDGIEEASRLRAKAGKEIEELTRNYLRKVLLDGDFETVPLGKVCKTMSGGTPSRSRSDYFDGKIPWLKSGELNDGLITDSEEHITQEALDNSNAKMFPKGTLLIALYGATVGKTGILGIDSSTNQAICALFPQKDVLERDYLHWFLKFKRNDFLSKSFGGAQPNISQALLRKTNVPLPTLPVQRRMVEYLNSLQTKVDELKELQKETENKIGELIPSFLDKAFRGEL